jgi:signal transduction histidine kinase
MADRKPRFSLRFVLIGINMVVLILPLAGIQLMRLYESALVRQTESALIAQAAFVAAFYRSLVKDQGTQDWHGMSRSVQAQAQLQTGGQWLPQPPVLDLATSAVLPPFPDGQQGENPQSFARLAGERMMPMLKDAQLTTLAGIRVVDPWGTIIASTGEDVGLSIGHAPEIRQALEGNPASSIRRKTEVVDVSTLDSVSRTSRIRVFVAAPILMYDRLIGAVMLSRTPPSIVQALYAKRWLLLQALTMLVGLVLLMSLVTFRLIARPISRLSHQASLVATGEISAQQAKQDADAHTPRSKEIAQLQQAITLMATTLEQRADYLQDFSRHVSHEFKTPIAGIRAAIEVLQDHREDMSEEQRLRFLANIAADADRLHRLTERLMQLTQAEIGTQSTTAVSLREAMVDAASAFPTVSLRSDRIDAGAVVSGNSNTVRAVLETLIENAAQHGATEVTAWSEATEMERSGVTLYVQDNGAGISASNREQIFTPFFTTQREAGGTGLGLTIAMALMRNMDATLALAEGNGPTTFALKFNRHLAT